MQGSIESISQASRRSVVRRAVQLEAEILCDLWDRPIALPARNLSTDGVWVETQLPLEPGEELIVSFVPPGQASREPVVLSATVCRTDLFRRKRDAGRSGMALRFMDAGESQLSALEQSLRGLPPPLPPKPEALEEEDETRLRLPAGRELEFVADGELLCGGFTQERGREDKPRVRCFTHIYTPRRPSLLRLRPVRDSRPCAGRRPSAQARRPVHASLA